MKSIKEIYELYNIPLNLQEHQLQVASVASWIVDHWQGIPIEKGQIIYGALFHDMGNIIKFNFSPEHTPFNYTVEEKLYWEKIQKFFIEKYGTDVHHATQVIVKEIGDPHKISSIVGGLGFNQLPKLWEEKNIVSIIIQYADMRVSPHGITTIDNRLTDFYKRYELRPDFNEKYPYHEKSKQILHEIEKYLVTNTSNELINLSKSTNLLYKDKLQNIKITIS